MSVINSNQGHVKTSEVGAISAQPLLSTLTREDLETMISQAVKAISSNSQKHSLVLTSDAAVTWTGTQIQMSSGNILLKLLQTESVGSVTVTIPAALMPISMSAGQVLYLHVSRTKLQSSFTAVAGDLVVTAEGSMPALSISQSDSTISELTSLVIANAQTVGAVVNLFWQINGLTWEPNKSALLGTVTSSTTMPVGSIIPYHLMGSAMPLGNTSLSAAGAPGWQLCDGRPVVDPNSSFKNPNRNSVGWPNTVTVSSWPGGDKYVPDLNGAAQTWNSTNTYSFGDRVRNTLNETDYFALSTITNESSLNLTTIPGWNYTTSYNIGAVIWFTHNFSTLEGSGFQVTAIFKSLQFGNVNHKPDITQTTAYWQPVWCLGAGSTARLSGTSTISLGVTRSPIYAACNPFYNSGNNSGSPNTYIRGSTASLASGYGGSNTHTNTLAEMFPHTHVVDDHYHTIFSYSSNNDFAHPERNVSGGVGSTGTVFTSKQTNSAGTIVTLNAQSSGGGAAYSIEPSNFSAVQIIRIY